MIRISMNNLKNDPPSNLPLLPPNVNGYTGAFTIVNIFLGEIYIERERDREGEGDMKLST